MLPSEQRNPSAFAPMHFGTQLRGLHAPCERFASRVAPGARITRFQLAADLGWMGLDTHRVSNKVSKTGFNHPISSSLTELCPAHALVHHSGSTESWYHSGFASPFLDPFDLRAQAGHA